MLIKFLQQFRRKPIVFDSFRVLIRQSNLGIHLDSVCKLLVACHWGVIEFLVARSPSF